jgi:hypothetical protein
MGNMECSENAFIHDRVEPNPTIVFEKGSSLLCEFQKAKEADPVAG